MGEHCDFENEIGFTPFRGYRSRVKSRRGKLVQMRLNDEELAAYKLRGGAVGIKQMLLDADNAALRDTLRAIATMDCLTREGEEPVHLLMMRLAREALGEGG